MGKEHFSAGNLIHLFHFNLILVKQLTICVGRRGDRVLFPSCMVISVQPFKQPLGGDHTKRWEWGNPGEDSVCCYLETIFFFFKWETIWLLREDISVLVTLA